MSETHFAELKRQAIRRLAGRSAGTGAGGGSHRRSAACPCRGHHRRLPDEFSGGLISHFPARRLAAGQPKGCFESKAQSYQIVYIIFSGRCVTCDHSKFSRGMLSLSSGSVFLLLESKVCISTSWSNNHSVVESFRREEFQRVVVIHGDMTH
jgi:hypothetical protein